MYSLFAKYPALMIAHQRAQPSRQVVLVTMAQRARHTECPDCGSPLAREGRCSFCPSCGFSVCG